MQTMKRINEDGLRLLQVSTVSAGTKDHNKLINRDATDQHPIEAITGLADTLATKADTSDVPTELSAEYDNGIVTIVMR